jgi:hypothetical protein
MSNGLSRRCALVNATVILQKCDLKLNERVSKAPGIKFYEAAFTTRFSKDRPNLNNETATRFASAKLIIPDVHRDYYNKK